MSPESQSHSQPSQTQAKIASPELHVSKKQSQDVQTQTMQEKEERQLVEDIHNHFKKKFGQHFECIICHEIFISPSIIKCGHSFCKHCIEKWNDAKNNEGNCPICHEEILEISPNHVLKDLIGKRNF